MRPVPQGFPSGYARYQLFGGEEPATMGTASACCHPAVPLPHCTRRSDVLPEEVGPPLAEKDELYFTGRALTRTLVRSVLASLLRPSTLPHCPPRFAAMSEIVFEHAYLPDTDQAHKSRTTQVLETNSILRYVSYADEKVAKEEAPARRYLYQRDRTPWRGYVWKAACLNDRSHPRSKLNPIGRLQMKS
ncbi:hypothetical protein AAVH_04283 [Aphelenchoides avenae]|nr:hypothetical protein AAVH_04283 [Aphelenchus avenae]